MAVGQSEGRAKGVSRRPCALVGVVPERMRRCYGVLYLRRGSTMAAGTVAIM
jgi:hypothetical protein